MEPTTTAVRDAEPIRSPAADAAALVGACIGDRYRLLEVIGEGGMGWVFRAEMLTTRKTVALKLIHSEFAKVDQVVRRFEREVQVASRLCHPNIVKVVDSGELNGRLFLAMEMLAGRSLADLIEQGDSPKRGRLHGVLDFFGTRRPGTRRQLTVARTVAIMRQVLDALEQAHSVGVVHRDLKPENIMLVPGRGPFSRECVKLLDFGIAKLGDDAEAPSQKLTQLGVAIGTPRYMSPEQAMGRKADARSDLYSCGVILYQMLTGRRPFEAESTAEVLSMHLNTAPKPLRSVAAEAGIPVALESAVLRALAKQPGERFQSAGELCKALERAATARDTSADISGLEKTMLALPSAPAYAHPQWIRVAVVAVAAVVAVIAIGDHHLPPRAPRRGREMVSSEANGSARRTTRSEPVGAERPVPSREPVGRAPPAVARAASEQPKRSPTQTRIVSKKPKLRQR